MEKAHIQAVVTKEEKEKIKKMAEADGRSVSSYIMILIRKGMLGSCEQNQAS